MRKFPKTTETSSRVCFLPTSREQNKYSVYDQYMEKIRKYISAFFFFSWSFTNNVSINRAVITPVKAACNSESDKIPSTTQAGATPRTDTGRQMLTSGPAAARLTLQTWQVSLHSSRSRTTHRSVCESQSMSVTVRPEIMHVTIKKKKERKKKMEPGLHSGAEVSR